jgi:putative endonuclease
MQRGGFTYIMTNKHHTVLYTGVTSNLSRRVHEHKTKLHPKSFTARYNVNKLVWYEGFHRIEEAITREKQIKAGSRQKKLDLINAQNPDWKDLIEEAEGF